MSDRSDCVRKTTSLPQSTRAIHASMNPSLEQVHHLYLSGTAGEHALGGPRGEDVSFG